ncbi:unnamed protein product, partial [Arabidopsis halleri]
SINYVLFSCSLARQVWALSGVPTPYGGFGYSSLFANFQFLLELALDKRLELSVIRSFPWILWRLWKNRNKFFFENLCFSPQDSIRKISEDVEEWFLAQSLAQEGEEDRGNSDGSKVQGWSHPIVSWLKCNIALVWSARNKIGGGAWVVRNDEGKVLVHSRKVFCGSNNKKEAMLMCLLWAMESFQSQNG